MSVFLCVFFFSLRLLYRPDLYWQNRKIEKSVNPGRAEHQNHQIEYIYLAKTDVVFTDVSILYTDC